MMFIFLIILFNQFAKSSFFSDILCNHKINKETESELFCLTNLLNLHFFADILYNHQINKGTESKSNAIVLS